MPVATHRRSAPNRCVGASTETRKSLLARTRGLNPRIGRPLAILAFSVWLTPGAATAQPGAAAPPAPAVAAESRNPHRAKSDAKDAGDAQPGPVRVALGGYAAVGATFLSNPDDDVASGVRIASHPDFGGTGIGAGVTGELRLYELFGVELGVRAISQFVAGTFKTANRSTAGVNIAQWEVHTSALAKLAVPVEFVNPVLGLGVDFIFPATPTVSPDDDVAGSFAGHASSYAMLAGAVGAEFDVGTEPGQLRLPLMLRGGFNPWLSNKLDDRADYSTNGGTISSVDFVTEWTGYVLVTLGLMAFL